MFKTEVKIDGMMCGMCEAHIADAIRKAFPEAAKVSVSRGKGTATFLTKERKTDEIVKCIIEQTGYTFISSSCEPYEQKGFFSRFK